MKIVQDALAVTGIPAYPLTWRVTDQYPVPPETYLVYPSTMTMCRKDTRFTCI